MKDFYAVRGLIKASKYRTEGNFAKIMDLSSRSLSLKLNGERAFTLPEVQLMVSLLEIPTNRIQYYFFGNTVQNN